MASSISSAPDSATRASTPTPEGTPSQGAKTTANAWLLLALRQDLDLNGDGQLSFEEFSQGKSSGNISAENQAQLAPIDQAAFDAIEQTDGATDSQVDLRVLAGNQYLINQIFQYGNPVPSGFLLASLSTSGQIADPSALTPEEQKTLADLVQKLCTSGFESLTPDEKTVVQRAATNLLRLDSSLGGLAAGTAPTPEQLSTAITTLTNRIGYETGYTPVASGVEAKNFDYQSLLGGGTGSDQLSLFAYNSVANQVKAEAGSLGQTDQIGTVYVPYLQREAKEVFNSEEWQEVPGETKALSAEQQAFVTEWIKTNDPLTADNIGQLTTELAAKFPLEAGWSFQTQQVADPWVGQRENLDVLQSQEAQAYREWSADGTPKVSSPTHRAQALTQELQAKQQAFVSAVTTLSETKALAIMDYLEGKDHDWHNDAVGDNGLGQLAGLTPDSPQWDQLAADRSDRTVPYEERQKYIDAAKLATSPEQAANLSALRAMGDDAGFYNKDDWQDWLGAQADVAPFAQSSPTPSAAQQDFAVAVSTLNKPSAWALMDLLEGPTTDMHNDLVGDLGLGKLAQLSPESAEWDQLPADKAVPDKAARQAMIDAAKLILSPEQTANRDALRALGDNAEYNKEDWQRWLDDQPSALYDLNHWLDRLRQGAAEVFKPIRVDRDHLSPGEEIGLGIITLGIFNAAYTGTHKPGYSAEQQFVVDQLKAQGRDTTALETAMEEAQGEWGRALEESIGWAVFGVVAAAACMGFVGSAVSQAAAAGARWGASVLSTVGQTMGRVIGTVVSALDQFVTGGVGTLLTSLGTKVPTWVKAAWDTFVKRAGEGASPQELTPLLATFREGLEALPAGTLTPEGQSLLPQVRELETKLSRASEAEAALAAPIKQPEPATRPAASTTPKSPAQLAEQDLTGVAWSNASQTRGKVTINGQSFDVVKPIEGQVLTGRLEQGGSVFKVLDPETGRPTGALLYKADDGSGWFRGGLVGGADPGTTVSPELPSLAKDNLIQIFHQLDPAAQQAFLLTSKEWRQTLGKEVRAVNVPGNNIDRVKKVLELCPNVESIRITGDVTSETLGAILKEVKGLKHLDLTGCVSLTNQHLHDYVSKMENLESLNISGSSITAVGVEALQRLEKLSQLTVEGCNLLHQRPRIHQLEGFTDEHNQRWRGVLEAAGLTLLIVPARRVLQF